METLNIYNLPDIDTIDELTESIEQINDLGKQFRHIHVELKSIMGEQDYAEAYIQYQTITEGVRNFVKKAKAKLKNVRKVEKEELEQRLREEKEREEERLKRQRMRRKLM